MELNELKELIELFAKSNVDKLDLEREGWTLKLGKKKGKVVAAMPASLPVAMPTPVAAVAGEASQDVEDEDLIYVTSPIVGTFYRSPNPNAPVFVKTGDQVHSGQTLCIVEAMKLMNEIQADQDGQIVKIYVENGQPVEYGTRLFAMKSV